jgi:hypothetical protein
VQYATLLAHAIRLGAKPVISGLMKDDLVSMFKNFFPSSLTTRLNKLEGIYLETLSSQLLEFEVKARANPIRVPFRCFLLG